MNKQKTIGKLYNAICEIKYYSQIGSGYTDAFEGIDEMQPLSLLFHKTEKNIDKINNILQYKLKI